jgi:hypothetical protein
MLMRRIWAEVAAGAKVRPSMGYHLSTILRAGLLDAPSCRSVDVGYSERPTEYTPIFVGEEANKRPCVASRMATIKGRANVAVEAQTAGGGHSPRLRRDGFG